MTRTVPGLLLASFVVAGCGRIAFDPRVDAAVDDGCWPAWRAHAPNVSGPQRVGELSTPTMSEGNPFLTADGLTLYYDQRSGPSPDPRDTFIAERPGPGQPFGTATPFAQVNTADDEGRLSTSADGSIVVFSSGRTGGTGGEDVWMMVRDQTTGQLSPPNQTLLAAVNTPAGESDPELSEDALRIYLAPSMGPMTQIIAVASRAAVTQPFGAYVDLGLGQPGLFSDPSVSPDELVVVFSYEVNGVDINDLYYATRASRDEPFGSLSEVPSLASPSNDSDAALSNDGCELFFRSDRTGSGDLYLATIDRP